MAMRNHLPASVLNLTRLRSFAKEAGGGSNQLQLASTDGLLRDMLASSLGIKTREVFYKV